MKAKRFKIKVEDIKERGRLAPASRPHKDKRNDYNRKRFNNPKNWE